MTFPARFAEAEPVDAGAAAPVAAEPGATTPVPATPARHNTRGSLPDPEPVRTAQYWEYIIRYQAGQVSVMKVAERRFRQAVVTPRRMGRYAIELWIGHELIDRIRFDFPGLALEPLPKEGPRPLKETPTLAKGATVSVRVLVPASPRATRAVLVDRATEAQTPLPWPPDAPLPPVTAPAPTDAAADALADPLDGGR